MTPTGSKTPWSHASCVERGGCGEDALCNARTSIIHVRVCVCVEFSRASPPTTQAEGSEFNALMTDTKNESNEKISQHSIATDVEFRAKIRAVSGIYFKHQLEEYARAIPEKLLTDGNSGFGLGLCRYTNMAKTTTLKKVDVEPEAGSSHSCPRTVKSALLNRAIQRFNF